jgi:hypothetical protein
MGSTVETAIEVRPFHPELAQGEIDELRRRVHATRWPERETVDDQTLSIEEVRAGFRSLR